MPFTFVSGGEEKMVDKVTKEDIQPGHPVDVSPLYELSDAYFQSRHDIRLQDFIGEIAPDAPCGTDLYLSDVFLKIEEARKADDPTLPRGVWEKKLKKSDWNAVSAIAMKALISQSRDLQLLAWLMEAEVRQQGLAAIAPLFALIELNINLFWADLFPVIENRERRQNIFHWLDAKVSLAINHAPLIPDQDASGQLTGIDLDRALVYERLLESREVSPDQIDGVTWPVFCQCAENMPNEHYQDMFISLENAVAAFTSLRDTLGRVAGEQDMPALRKLEEQLEKNVEFACMELERRGLLDDLLAPPVDSPADDPGVATQNVGGEPGDVPTRVQIYQQLSVLAEQLARAEPHSPVPNLLKKAVQWGQLSSAELYEELFLKNNGQLNIFDIVGISSPQEEQS